MDEIIIKINHICVIQMLEEKVGEKISTYKYLEKYSIKSLEEIRDDLVKQYNQKIKGYL